VTERPFSQFASRIQQRSAGGTRLLQLTQCRVVCDQHDLAIDSTQDRIDGSHQATDCHRSLLHIGGGSHPLSSRDVLTSRRKSTTDRRNCSRPLLASCLWITKNIREQTNL
jgi:mitochondrial fission protein ELM1